MKYLCVLLLLVGCADPFSVDDRQFTPPPIYRHWWDSVELCTKIHRSYDAVHWRIAAARTIVLNGEILVGAWERSTNTIVMDERYSMDQEMVRHEMVHAVIQRTDHPYAVFGPQGCNIGATPPIP